MYALPPFTMDKSFGSGPLTQADLDDYRKRLGGKSPTPMDAMRFAELLMKLTDRLVDEDLQAYNNSIYVLKAQSGPLTAEKKVQAEAVIQRLETRALNADKSKVTASRMESNNIEGLRVRLVSDPSKRGMVVPHSSGGKFCDKMGQLFEVQIDGQGTVSSHRRTELQIICAKCNDKDGTNRCSRCRYQRYCSTTCQRADWADHKNKCKPEQGTKRKI
jgi:hypothetical protein